MELLISASFIAAFFAGIAALFAPCCITVLLPTYFASIFKQRSTIFLMTFVYFLGLLAVFMPIGLGASAVTQLFSAYHNIIFTFGSLFLILLGLTLVLGFQFSFPILVHPQLKNSGFLSVFALGVFSGIATTCCAPVLAGVLTLAALPASFLLGGAYTLAYVLGMVIPLFVLSMFLDKNKFTQKFFTFRKTVSYSIFGKKIRVVIAYLALTNNLVTHASYQISINVYLTRFIQFIGTYTKIIPEPAWAIIFFVIFLAIAAKSLKEFFKSRVNHARKKEGD
ncbi:MAG: Cytochrome c biogenesis protein transmembrane region [Candidatus Curtissbacteria bacterium GW2011_GWA1_40_24]|uniref:Cytochrome c biogenesis protein transmembrane region n=1 Tax=Candidatus Curtissbacteria bacterium GW2011_GWA1_40_24 TaxID=1618406 RepID=A0A0G0RQL2_9BACT|nr:MAG: Cytochrome c biogenesis protein transmembrane region [Candidatus Curtissbacteria bacterium GW2011_GWA1_40_24]